METLLIEKGKSSPHIRLDGAARTLTFRGESFPENAAAFYEPVTRWINEYFSTVSTEATTVEFEIVYFNSSTSKIFMSLFSLLDALAGEGKKITVNWRVQEINETALECGEEFKEDLEDLEFNIVVI